VQFDPVFDSYDFIYRQSSNQDRRFVPDALDEQPEPTENMQAEALRTRRTAVDQIPPYSLQIAFQDHVGCGDEPPPAQITTATEYEARVPVNDGLLLVRMPSAILLKWHGLTYTTAPARTLSSGNLDFGQGDRKAFHRSQPP